MSADISVRCEATGEGWTCAVSVAEGAGATTHDVTVSEAERGQFSPGAEVEQLVEESFRFLLEREPKESILRRFRLSEIERYFPEYTDEIRRRLER